MIQQQMLDAFNAQREVHKRLALLEHGHQSAAPEASASQVGPTCLTTMASLVELSQMEGLSPKRYCNRCIVKYAAAMCFAGEKGTLVGWRCTLSGA